MSRSMAKVIRFDERSAIISSQMRRGVHTVVMIRHGESLVSEYFFIALIILFYGSIPVTIVNSSTFLIYSGMSRNGTQDGVMSH